MSAIAVPNGLKLVEGTLDYPGGNKISHNLKNNFFLKFSFSKIEFLTKIDCIDGHFI